MINVKLKTNGEPNFKQLGLTFSQAMVMYELTRLGGQATQKELETALEISHPTITGLVKRMEKTGFVTTWFSNEDKRNKIVKLTQKALDTSNGLEETAKMQNEIMLKSLSQEQINELSDMLVIIYNNIK